MNSAIKRFRLGPPIFPGHTANLLSPCFFDWYIFTASFTYNKIACLTDQSLPQTQDVNNHTNLLTCSGGRTTTSSSKKDSRSSSLHIYTFWNSPPTMLVIYLWGLYSMSSVYYELLHFLPSSPHSGWIQSSAVFCAAPLLSQGTQPSYYLHASWIYRSRRSLPAFQGINFCSNQFQISMITHMTKVVQHVSCSKTIEAVGGLNMCVCEDEFHLARLDQLPTVCYAIFCLQLLPNK